MSMFRVTKTDVITSNGEDQCHGLNVCVPQRNPYLEILIPYVMILGGWPLGSD